MSKTSKLLATVGALGALAVSGLVGAAPAQPADTTVPPCAQAPQYSRADQVAARYEGLANMLTLKAEQQSAWKAYVDARVALAAPQKKWDKPAVDTQERLERRAEAAEARVALLKTVTSARAELLKILSPEQKYVLESYEFTHRGKAAGGMRGMGPGFHHGMAPGFHHGMGYGMTYHGMPPRPDCPMMKN